MFLFVSGFDAHRRKRRSEVNSRPLFDSKGKSDEKRQKVKELLGKRIHRLPKRTVTSLSSVSKFLGIGPEKARTRARAQIKGLQMKGPS